MRTLFGIHDFHGFFTLLLVFMVNAQGEDTVECEEAGGECVLENLTVNCVEYLPLQGCDDHEICCITPHWEQRQSEVDCEEAGGNCVSEDLTVNCVEYLPLHGCDDNEICCITPHFDNRGTCAEPPESCKNDYSGICERECTRSRMNVGRCDDGCTCCGCKIKRKCKKNGGFCVTENTVCEGQLIDKWCAGKKCFCCIPDCPSSDVCLSEGGRCSKTCREDEYLQQEIDCPNDGCSCCLPRPPPSSSVAPAEPCPETWILNGDYCYFFSSEYTQQPDARRICQTYGADLVSIRSQAEQDFVSSYSGYKNWWVGFSDIAVEGNFVWLDGSPNTYQHWDSGEPNDALGVEDCTEMWYNDYWNDVPCDVSKYYVCKKLRS